MIKTALKTATVTATIAGATFLAAPAHADTHTHNTNKGRATGNTVNFMVVGGYGVTCGTVSVAGQAGTSCDGDAVHNDGNRSLAGGEYGEGYGGLRGER
ncbi:hypothetical protein [Actinomadura oligospora]|uniref:hypothetical protein n=1 Tax=Actinomadura oligospora TaxID=111804 RepID=UPI0004B44F2F|nr:hypothetical protein [Actinomadura oligospora]